MKTHFLFPRQFRILGLLLFIPSLITAIILRFIDYDFEQSLQTKVFAIFDNGIMGDTTFLTVIENPVADEILLILLIVGGLLAGFSKLRNEDELIAQIRYESLVWAVYFNFGVMIFATLFVYGTFYFDVLTANVFTLLFFFLIRFHLMLYRLNKSASDEE